MSGTLCIFQTERYFTPYPHMSRDFGSGCPVTDDTDISRAFLYFSR